MQMAITFMAVIAGLVFFRGGGLAGGRIHFRSGDPSVFRAAHASGESRSGALRRKGERRC